jgi:hypothetical protein
MDVIVAADGPRPIERQGSVARDALGRRLDDIRSQVEATYRATTIAQFVREQEASTEVLVTKGE